MTDDQFRARICEPSTCEAGPQEAAETGVINIYEPDQPSFGEERATNVLWGRVITLGVVLLLVFFLGRASGGSSEEVDTLRDQLAAARAEIDQLESETRAPVQPSPTLSPVISPGAPGAGATATPSPTGTAAATTEQSYVVKSGDTLSRIANRFYGNAQLDDCIATANQIANASALTVGRTLKIPPRASCG